MLLLTSSPLLLSLLLLRHGRARDLTLRVLISLAPGSDTCTKGRHGLSQTVSGFGDAPCQLFV